MAFMNRKLSTENEDTYDEVEEVSDRNNRETTFGEMQELGNRQCTSPTDDQLTLPLQKNDTSGSCQTNRKACIFKTMLIVLLMVGTSITTVLLDRSLFNQGHSEMNTSKCQSERMDILDDRMVRMNNVIKQLETKVEHQSQDDRMVRMGNVIKQLETKVEHQSQALGATYIRWARTQCPSETELVYSGYAGGGRYDEEGSAAEPVCLPKDPEFNKTSGSGSGRMYGAEFYSNSFASNSVNQDVPCAVCRTRSSTSVIMIPGKTSCHTGWKREYHGYLASGSYADKAANTYVCIDINPEYVSGGSAWSGYSKLFFEVIVKCGVLKCPPYHEGYPLTCVVCSK